jgi:hypothetical protein
MGVHRVWKNHFVSELGTLYVIKQAISIQAKYTHT